MVSCHCWNVPRDGHQVDCRLPAQRLPREPEDIEAQIMAERDPEDGPPGFTEED